MKKDKKKEQKVVALAAFEHINHDAAGIDVGANEFYVALPKGRASERVRTLLTFTADIHRLADWLVQCGVQTVALASTGVYWMPLYEILEKRGFEMELVHARHLQNVSGRKSDVLDCQGRQQLHTDGLLRASFRPAQQIWAMRSLVRHRARRVAYRAAHTQSEHRQKALTWMNVRLTNVLSAMTGVTGMKIMRAILSGERNRKVLAS